MPTAVPACYRSVAAYNEDAPPGRRLPAGDQDWPGGHLIDYEHACTASGDTREIDLGVAYVLPNGFATGAASDRVTVVAVPNAERTGWVVVLAWDVPRAAHRVFEVYRRGTATEAAHRLQEVDDPPPADRA